MSWKRCRKLRTDVMRQSKIHTSMESVDNDDIRFQAGLGC